MVGHARAHGLSRAAALCRAHRLAGAGAGGAGAAKFRAPLVHLWLGREAHLVHYPVKAGALINIVVIINDPWNAPGWSAPAQRDELLPRLSVERVAPAVLG